MFSSALKSFSSNISANYSLAPEHSSTSGPWKIFDGKKKSTGKAASIFVFERKSLESGGGGFGSRGGNATIKRAHDEVIERLKKEASSLARLRHPSILELVEPVEDTRSGGLIFATEPITASLGGLLQEKDEQEISGGIAGRPSRYVVDDPDSGGKKRREVEIDELEIQKGLLQVAKGLEFLHESAGLVHGNLTPEGIFVNIKSDWKISGLGFCSPANGNVTNSSVIPIALSEALNYDARLPRTVQLNLDYTSPDFVLDNNLNTSADMFSLGLIIIALYNSPHKSPLETNQSQSLYKKMFSSSSAMPSRTNNFLSSQPIPKDITTDLLPKLITRRPAQRLDSREFQQAKCFDNILVSTIRFLDNLPAKSHQEKAQFMRGAPRILPQFPKSVLEKKILPVLLDQMKDRDLIAATMQNVFVVIKLLPAARRAFSEKVIPRLKETFLAPVAKSQQPERDSFKESGMSIILENITLVTENCSGKDFKDDILPIIILCLDSPTHSLVGASLQSLPVVLPILDFTTIKNELFPIIAQVFSKTSSMTIKIKGLDALKVLCGGSTDSLSSGNGQEIEMMKPSSKINPSSVLDKYTMQEKVVPLIRAIKTKEPAVMMAALGVFQQVGKVADIEFLASDILPCLWQFSLGPLLNLQQFQAFVTLIKSLSSRIELEQSRRLQETGGGNTTNGRVSNSNVLNSFQNYSGGRDDEEDFESLVSGRKAVSSPDKALPESRWEDNVSHRPTVNRTTSNQRSMHTPRFSWSSMNDTTEPPKSINTPVMTTSTTSRTVTPDFNSQGLGSIMQSSNILKSSSSSFSQPTQQAFPPLQPQRAQSSGLAPAQVRSQTSGPTALSIDWSSSTASNNPWTSLESANAGFATSSNTPPSFNIAPPQIQTNVWSNSQSSQPSTNTFTNSTTLSKSGLDKYESLL